MIGYVYNSIADLSKGLSSAGISKVDYKQILGASVDNKYNLIPSLCTKCNV